MLSEVETSLHHNMMRTLDYARDDRKKNVLDDSEMVPIIGNAKQSGFIIHNCFISLCSKF